MGSKSTIEWTESTWNPVTGCTKISDGCKHCYAERMALRLKAMGQPNYVNGFSVTLHEQMLELHPCYTGTEVRPASEAVLQYCYLPTDIVP